MSKFISLFSVRTFVVSFAALFMLGSLVPMLATADYSNNGCNNSSNYNNWFYNNNWNGSTTANNCQNGQLLVYVQVNNNTSNYNNTNEVPQDFTVTVSGQNVSNPSFAGSLSGTGVTLIGSYSVQTAAMSGYVASYSTGCSGTVVNGQQATCVITESNTSGYGYGYNYNNSYPYNYYNGYTTLPLTCSPNNQTVAANQPITFTAEGGADSQYNWVANYTQNYYNVGPSLTVPLTQTGVQTVTVTNGSETATCTINVLPYGATVGLVNPINTYPVSGNYPTTTVYPTTVDSSYPSVVVTPTYIPLLPNTGYAPIDSEAIAFVFAFLFAAVIAAYPYVNKAFATILG